MDGSVGSSQPRSLLMSWTRLPLPSQSSKNSSIVTLRGWTPPNSGLVDFLAPLLVGRFQVALRLTDSSFGLKRQASGEEPSSGISVAFGTALASYPAPRKPLWASSSVSFAIWLPVASRVGPVHLTGHAS